MYVLRVVEAIKEKYHPENRLLRCENEIFMGSKEVKIDRLPMRRIIRV